MSSVAVAVVDVGKVANTGWWHISVSNDQCGGHDLNEFVTYLLRDLSTGGKVALGFEAPMFIPLPSSTEGIGRQRVGDAGMPWCFGAGTIALAFGLQEAAFVLTALAQQSRQTIRAGLDMSRLASDELDLVVWEAFVSGAAKDHAAADPHVADARAAAVEFERRYGYAGFASDISENQVISLAGAALLAAGLTTDTTLVTSPCMVVKAPAV